MFSYFFNMKKGFSPVDDACDEGDCDGDGIGYAEKNPIPPA